MNRRRFLKGLSAMALASLAPASASGFGASSAFTIGRIEYDGNWDDRPGAAHKLLLEVEKRTSIVIGSRCPPVRPDGAALFDTPFTIFSGDRGFEPLSEGVRRNIETYLRAGGTILFDSSEGDADGEFILAVRRELQAILPDSPLQRVPAAHVVYKSFYLIDDAPGRLTIVPYMEACEEDGRLVALVSFNDLQGAWARDNFGNWLYEVHPGGERQREMAFRMGINLAMYVLCQDYKEDQVHVPFILHRRQWRLD